MTNKSLMFILVVSSIINNSIGQNPFEMKNVVPNTPEAAALNKLVNYKVDRNTGVPDISIPLYKIEQGGLALPLTLRYHAGGFKINERATRVGLGWSLSADIQITRTINGLDDLSGNGYINNSLIKPYSITQSSYPFVDANARFPDANIYDLAAGNTDGLPDRFNYKLLNKAGSFFFRKNSSGTGYTIVPVPYDKIQITFNNNQFTIIDTDGSIYYFGVPGTPALQNGTELTGGVGVGGICVDCHITAWKCMKIVNAQGTDEFNFSYQEKSIVTYKSYPDRIDYYVANQPWIGPDYATSENKNYEYFDQLPPLEMYKRSIPRWFEYFGATSTSLFHWPYSDDQDVFVDKVYKVDDGTSAVQMTTVAGLSLSQISFRGGYITFSGADRLTFITVFNSRDERVKQFQLFQSYTTPIHMTEAKLYNGSNFQGTMYLDSVYSGITGGEIERYGLFYNDKFCYGNHLKGHDAWGYPNNTTQEIGEPGATISPNSSIPRKRLIVPTYFPSYLSPPIDSLPVVIGRNDWAATVDESSMLRGVLKRIVYPTGGFTEFRFEENKYNEAYYETSLEPLSFYLPQACGGLRIKTISYFDDHSEAYPKSQKYFRYGKDEEGTGTAIIRPVIDTSLGTYNIDAVDTRQIIGYIEANAPNCSNRSCLLVQHAEWKISYSDAATLDYTYDNGAPIYYEKVTEYNSDFGQRSGKTVFEYYPPDEFQNSWQVPYITESRISGTNIPIIRTSGLMGVLKSIGKYKYTLYKGYDLLERTRYEYELYLEPTLITAAYGAFKVLYSGVFTNSPENWYDDRYSFSNSVPPLISDEGDYYYGAYGIAAGKLLIKSEIGELYDSLNIPVTTRKDYSYNYQYLQPASVQETNSKGETLYKYIKYPYDLSGIYTAMVSKNMISSVIEENVKKYTSAGFKELSMKKANYDYFTDNNIILPASIDLSYEGGPLVRQVTFNEYDQYGNLLQRTDQDGLVVSYLWGYNGLYPVAEIKGIPYATIPLAYKSNVSILNPPGDAALRLVLDNLRNEISLGSALLTTYTYSRLTGVSSMGDYNNKLTFYEYDPTGRLSFVKDHNGAILKRFNYHLDKGPLTPTPTILVRDPHLETGAVWNSLDEGAGNYIDVTSWMNYLPSDSVAQVKIIGIYNVSSSYPSDIIVDFIRNGEVAYSKSVPFNSAAAGGPPLTYATINIRAGAYKLSFRPAPTNYSKYGLLMIDISNKNVYPDPLAQYHFRSGDEFNFLADGNYEIMAHNVY